MSHSDERSISEEISPIVFMSRIADGIDAYWHQLTDSCERKTLLLIAVLVKSFSKMIQTCKLDTLCKDRFDPKYFRINAGQILWPFPADQSSCLIW